MKWFEGNIPSAIQQAKEKHAIFIVYISGTDDVSKNMDETWSNSEVEQICEENKCVSLKLEANSESCGQFCMIYPVVCVPSTFFIGENGVPLEVTGGHMEPAAFVQKIQQVIQMHNSQKSGQKVEPLTSTQQGAAQAQEAASSKTEMPEEGATASTSAPQTAQVPLDQRMENARELLRIQREEKARKEVEELKKKEAERRNLGKGLTELQKFKEEQARQETLDEWKKEKEEKKRDKERVREQLARDRAEKAAKFHAQKREQEMTKAARPSTERNDAEHSDKSDSEQLSGQLRDLRGEKTAMFHAEKEEQRKKMEKRREVRLQNENQLVEQKIQATKQLKEQIVSDRDEKNARFRAEREEREKKTEDAKRAKMEEQAEIEARTQAAKMEKARIQFRLPDGSSIVNQFSSTDTLQTARDFLTERVGSKYGKFILSTHHPRRDFNDSDSCLSLMDLDLAPSAIVIVLPGSRSTVPRPASSDDGGGLMTMLFAPFIALWNFLYYFLFSSAPSSQGDAGNTPQQSNQSSQGDGSLSSQQGRPQAASGLRRRQEGNITRLSALQDDDDDRTTWNGNSTQQM